MRPGTAMEYLEWRHNEVHKKRDEPVLYANIQRRKTVKKNSRLESVMHPQGMHGIWQHQDRKHN